MDGRLEAEFTCDPASVRAAREFVAAALAAWDREDLTEVASLCTSEVATNAVRHARTAFRVAVEARASEVVVEIEDQGEGEPVSAPPDYDRDSGRGLWLVAATAARWGCDKLVGGGKVVWFSVSSLSLPQP